MPVACSKTVIHVVTSLGFGGVEKRMENIARASKESMLRHRFCAVGPGGSTEKALLATGAQVDCLDKPTAIPSSGAVLNLYRYFGKIQPLVVHTHGAEANFHGLIAAKLAGVPVRIGEEIGIPQHSARAKFVFRQVYRAAHRVVCVSDSVMRWLTDSGEVPHYKATRIYNPVVLSKMSPNGSFSGHPFRIGFVGRLEPVKNPFALLQAMKELLDQGISAELWVVGDGSERGRMEQYIAENGLGEIVCLFGYQPDPERFLCECDLYVQPSISEGFGIALVEAMGLGLPVISIAVGGASEIIEHGRTGWLIQEPDALTIVNAIKRVLLLDNEQRRAIGRAAANSVNGRFEPAIYLQAISSLYMDVLASRNKVWCE